MSEASTTTEGDVTSEMEIDAFRRLFPVRFYDRYLTESIRPDGRSLGSARGTTVALGAVTSANGSALAKIGFTTMLAAIKMEVMTPLPESPNDGRIEIEFHMPPICSPNIRPGRPAELAPTISKQLSDCILCSGMINLKELSLVGGKAAWVTYLDIYCLDADGALFDAALLSAVAAFSHLRIPEVTMNEEGKIVSVSEEKRKLTLINLPFSTTFVLHKNHILVDPTAEEEAVMESSVTVVLDSCGRLLAFYKPGGSKLASTSAIQDCTVFAKQRAGELKTILEEAISTMEID